MASALMNVRVTGESPAVMFSIRSKEHVIANTVTTLISGLMNCSIDVVKSGRIEYC